MADRLIVLPDVRVVSADELAASGAAMVAQALERAIAARGVARVALAGGGTPRPIYQALACEPHASHIEWDKVHVYFGDERCVDADDDSSNYRMAKDSLLDHVAVAAENIHRIRGELAPADAARDYEASLLPLDIVLLGMGGDGHTASLFPGTDLDQQAAVLATVSPVAPTNRVSLGLAPINEAGVVLFIIAGASKASRLAEVHAEIIAGAPVLPAAFVQPASGELWWLVDVAAAAELPARPKEKQ